jgi:hypothetical protein
MLGRALRGCFDKMGEGLCHRNEMYLAVLIVMAANLEVNAGGLKEKGIGKESWSCLKMTMRQSSEMGNKALDGA